MRPIAGVALWRWVVLLAAVVLLLVALLAPSSTSAVATVDGRPITLSTYREWLKSAAVSVHASNRAVPGFVPDAPGYSRCIAFERQATKSGSKATSVGTLRADCRQIRLALAEEVMQFLLSGQWFLDEAAREHITVTSAQVQHALRTSFPHTTGLTQFLNSNGLSRGDLEFEARAALVASRLSARHAGPAPTITAAQITSYYNANRAQIGNKTLVQATPLIRQALIAQAQAPQFAAWLSTLQRHFQPRTICARGYRIAYYCRRAS